MRRFAEKLVVGIIGIVLYLVISVGVVSANVTTDVPEGYIGVYTKEDLNNIRNQLDEKYILMNDICFTEEDFTSNGAFYNGGKGWEPIGKDAKSAFTGEFEGNGYHIEGIRVTVESNKAGYWGVFGYNKGTICRLGLIDQRIKIHIISKEAGVGTDYAGGISGYNMGQITECYTQGEVESVHEAQYGGSYAGGIVGVNAGNVSNCYSISNVRCTSTYNNHIYGGGICGQGNAEKCYAIGNVVVSVPDAAYGNISAAAPGKSSEACYALENVVKDAEFQKDFEGNAKILSDEEMRNSESFVEFDFAEIWEMDKESLYPYPILRNISHVEMKENTTDFAGGNGTIYNPYCIQTVSHLRNIKENAGACYKLIADMEFEGTANEQQWEMIGTIRQNSFYGDFDGNGHVIHGLKIDVQTDSCVNAGLFGYSEGRIRNLGVVNGTYSVIVKDHEVITKESYTYVGGIAGYNDGVITQCYNTNSIVVTDELTKGIYHIQAGGISGYSKLVKNCYNTGYIMAGGKYPDAAGITADGDKAILCYNVGFVQQIDKSTAEAAGISAGSFIDVMNSYSVPVSEYHSYEDGTEFLSEEKMRNKDYYKEFDFVQIWEMKDNFPYPQLRSAAHVNPPENVIEFAGGRGTRYQPYLIETKEQLKNIGLYKAAYFRLKNDIDFEGDNWQAIAIEEAEAFCGGINGDGHSIINMKSTESFIGYNHGLIENLSFVNCSFTFEQSKKDKSYQGSICGRNGIMSEIRNCKIHNSEIQMMSDNTDNYVGGITGYNQGIIADTCYTGKINTDFSGTSEGDVGGIAGRNEKNGKIENCYISGSLTGQHNLQESNHIYWGGITGTNDSKGIIRNCFCSGSFRVTGMLKSKANAYLGMILGFNANNGLIENVYQCVDMSQSYTKTGSVYASGYGNEVKNAYYINTQKMDIYNGTALSAGEMNKADSFAGFDFASVWWIDDSDESDYRYPRLRSVPYEGHNKTHSLMECEVKSVESVTYTGEPIEPEPEVSYNDMKLRKNVDYTLEYDNNIEAGTAQIVVRGTGSYEGEVRIEFVIQPCDISIYDAVLSETKYTYSGKAFEPTVYIEGLSEGKDYQVAYSDNTNAGIAKVFIIGEGNYTGIMQQEFEIKKADLRKKTVKLSYTICTYSGKAKKPAVKISGLTSEKHFSTAYRNNEKVGTATVTITGKGNYTGKVTKTFKINPRKTEISSLKSSKRGFTVKWKKKTIQTSGYQIQYSTSSAFKSKKTITVSSNKTTSKKITNLSAKKKYYVRVRTYKTVGGKKYYSGWSTKKTVKTRS